LLLGPAAKRSGNKCFRIRGDDALDLILRFGKKFKVDVSGFMAADYFEGEGMNWLMPDIQPGKKILKIKHLEKAVVAGKLDESVINE
jgi:hypothetical protein